MTSLVRAWDGVSFRWLHGGAAVVTALLGLFLEGSVVGGALVPLLLLTSTSDHHHPPARSEDPSSVGYALYLAAALAQQVLATMSALCWVVVMTSDPGYLTLPPLSAPVAHSPHGTGVVVGCEMFSNTTTSFVTVRCIPCAAAGG